MSEKQVLGVAKQLERIGATLLSVPPSVVVQTLTYGELSGFLDRMVYDMLNYAPDLFTVNGSQPAEDVNALAPAPLKLYLYVLALDWFRKQGCLTVPSGFIVPDATSLSVPSPLMAWLSYIAKYKEGGTEGIPAYSVGTTPAIVNWNMTKGTPVESDLSQGNAFMFQYVRSPTLGEYIQTAGSVPTSAQTVSGFWTSYSKTYSELIQRSGYPCLPMPQEVPMAPDGSFFCTVWNGGGGGSIAAPNAWLGSVFHKVDKEMAILYYDGTEVDTRVVHAVKTFPLGLPLIPIRFNQTNAATTMETYGLPETLDACRGYFVMVLRTMNYVLGMNVGKDRNWAGEPLSSFWPIFRPVTMEYYNQACWSVLEEVAKISNVSAGMTNPLPSLDATKAMAFMAWHHSAVLVRMQPYRIHYEVGIGDNTTGTFRNQSLMMPSSFRGGMKVHSALAVALNELGPVVKDARLNLPFMMRFGNNGWYRLTDQAANNVQSGGIPQSVYNYMLSSSVPASWAPAFKWGNQVLNSTWISNYTAAKIGNSSTTAFLLVPWEAAGRLGELASQVSTNTVSYGRGFTFFPMSNNVRGGLGVLCGAQAVGQNTNVMGDWDVQDATAVKIIEINTNVASGTATQLVTVTRLLTGLTTCVPLSPEEAALVLYVPWVIDQSFSSYCKYRLQFHDSGGVRSIQQSIASDLCSPGGVFMQMLSEAMMKRHGSVSSLGVVGANDNPDVCLWDAAKALFRTVGTTLLDIAPAAASAGCNLFAPGTGAACGLLASNVASTVKDLAGVGSIRHGVSTPSKELDKVVEEVKEVRKASKGLEPQQRSTAPKVDYKPTPNGNKVIEKSKPKLLTTQPKIKVSVQPRHKVVLKNRLSSTPKKGASVTKRK